MTTKKQGSSQLRKGRFSECGGLYFVTKTLIGGSRFSIEQCQDVAEAVCYCRGKDSMYLHAFVVMPDHWHALISLRGAKPLARVIRDVNARASYPTRRSGGIIDWQEGFHDHKVRQNEKVTDIVAYIEANPVRKELSMMPGEWNWSSACERYRNRLDRNYLGYERWG